MPYVLVRTISSNIQNEAAIDVVAEGADNQAVRGRSMARTVEMCSSKGMEGIPRTVVGALLRHRRILCVLGYAAPPSCWPNLHNSTLPPSVVHVIIILNERLGRWVGG